MSDYPGRGETVPIGADRTAYLVGPTSGDGPWPGMVLIHELFGLTANARSLADRLAGLGYVVIVPDLFPGGQARCLVRTFRAAFAGSGPVFDDIETARAHLQDRGDCTGRLGVIGFCMGGGFAMVAARSGFEAALPFYGALPVGAKAAVAGTTATVEAAYGIQDRMLPFGPTRQARRTRDAFTCAGAPVRVTPYDAGHSFMSDPDLDAPNGPVDEWFRRVLGVGPDPEAADVAWSRIESFLAERLRA